MPNFIHSFKTFIHKFVIMRGALIDHNLAIKLAILPLPTRPRSGFVHGFFLVVNTQLYKRLCALVCSTVREHELKVG